MNAGFNIFLGICIGYDSLFFKYSDFPTTVLAVKDCVTGYNPRASIYLSDIYYQKIKHPGCNLFFYYKSKANSHEFEYSLNNKKHVIAACQIKCDATGNGADCRANNME